MKEFDLEQYIKEELEEVAIYAGKGNIPRTNSRINRLVEAIASNKKELGKELVDSIKNTKILAYTNCINNLLGSAMTFAKKANKRMAGICLDLAVDYSLDIYDFRPSKKHLEYISDKIFQISSDVNRVILKSEKRPNGFLKVLFPVYYHENEVPEAKDFADYFSTIKKTKRGKEVEIRTVFIKHNITY